MMRPSAGLLAVFLVLAILFSVLAQSSESKRRTQQENVLLLQRVVSHLGLSDLALSTEARYTRHPAVSDAVVVSMDHPGAIDHFPSTFFWAPVER
jgi:biotin transporter BioY